MRKKSRHLNLKNLRNRVLCLLIICIFIVYVYIFTSTVRTCQYSGEIIEETQKLQITTKKVAYRVMPTLSKVVNNSVTSVKLPAVEKAANGTVTSVKQLTLETVFNDLLTLEKVTNGTVTSVKQPAFEKVANATVTSVKQPAFEKVANATVTSVKQPAFKKVANASVTSVKQPAFEKVANGTVTSVKQLILEKVDNSPVTSVKHPALEKVANGTVTSVKHPALEKVDNSPVTSVKHPALEKVANGTVTSVKHPALEKVANGPSVKHPALEKVANGPVTSVKHPALEKVANGTVTLIKHPALEKVANGTVTSVKHPALRYEPVFLMNPSEMCSTKNLNMIVYVHSAVSYLKKRHAIRQTWGSNTYLEKYKTKIVFVTGTSDNSAISQKVKLENEKYGDIVMANFHDAYRNLSMKAKSSLIWVSKYCGNVTYVLKSDDDTFVHFERLQKFISTLESKSKPYTNLLACNFEKTVVTPVRRKGNKVYLSMEEYPFKKFPPFCQGMAYLMSSDVVHKLSEGVRNPATNQPFVWLDDVYITGIIFNNLKLNHTHLGFAFANHASIEKLKTQPSLIFFQTNQMVSMWKERPLLKDS